MLNPNSIAQINRALENSFANLKKDMNEMKFALSSNAEQNSRLKAQIEEIKSDSVTKDKLNVTKIKIGELSDDVHKITEIEKQLKAAGTTRQLQKYIDDLNVKLIALDVRFQNLNKTTVSESQMKTLVTQINTELNKMALELREAERKRDEIRRADIEHYTKHLVEKINFTNNDIAALRKSVKDYVDRNEVKKIIDDISNDFVDVRKEIQAIYKRDHVFVRESEVKSIVNNVNKEFDGIANELEAFKKQNKEFVTANQIKGLIDDISNEFNEVRKDVSKIDSKKIIEEVKKDTATRKDVEDLKRTFSDLQKVASKSVSKDEFTKEIESIDRELAKVDKALGRENVSSTYGASVVLGDQKAAKKVKVIETRPHKKKYLFGNFMIFASFVLLLSSIYSFYAGYASATDNFAISAVVVFIIGMFFRAYALIKGK